MKWRKTNRSKRVSRSCRNHGSCAWCRGNRLAQARRSLPADAAEQLGYAGADRCEANAMARLAAYESGAP